MAIEPQFFSSVAGAFGNDITGGGSSAQSAMRGLLSAGAAAGQFDPGYMSQLAGMGATSPFFGIGQPTNFANSFPQQQINFDQRKWEQQQLNRDQLLGILGLKQLGGDGGGLLGTNFFGSVLNNTLPNVVGGITGNLPGGGGGGRLGSPGFADSPENPGSPGGGSGNLFSGGSGATGGGLFDQLLNARGSFGRDILSDISGVGNSRRSAINEDYQNLGNSALARLDARGLGSSNLGAATMQGTEKGRQRALGELEDSLLQQQIGAKMNIGEGLFKDVGSEMDRGVQRQGLAVQQQGNMLDLLSSVFGSALNVV